MKSILSDLGLLFAEATPEVKAAAFKVKLTLEVSFAFACEVALPVNDNVNTVELVRVTTKVKPEGTPVTEYAVPLTNGPATKVSLATVMVFVAVIAPRLVAPSANEAPL